jgi:hypothetical protein
MYCSGCGSPIAPGLSFCNRCGTSLKEAGGHKQTLAVSALVIAMTVIALSGMGIMLGGPIALKKEAGFGEELIVLFMFLSFLIASLTEVFLYRQLGRLTTSREKNQLLAPPMAPAMQAEFRVPQPRTLAEPIPISSVTENTTRTLGFSHEERNR